MNSVCELGRNTMHREARRLRELLAQPTIARAIGAHDALGATIGDQAGFDAIWSSGLEISTSHGVPDANILTMTEFLDAAAAMARSASIPIVADCDTGFGNSNNVIHMVRSFEAAGVAGVSIEDKLFPKVNSFVPGRQELAPVAEFVGKIMAAKNAQRSDDFVVIARVEALVAGHGIEEALRRGRAYADAGADAVLIHSKSKTPDEILEFVRRWEARAPLVVVPTTYHQISAEELEAVGIALLIYANHGLRASIRAMQETYSRILQTGSTSAVESDIASMTEVFELQGMPQMKADEKAFLRAGEPTRVVIPAAGDHSGEASMREIAADVPMAMVDIHGEPLLQRQVETLNRVGVQDVRVISGHRADRIDVEGVQVVHHERWAQTGIAASILSAGSAQQTRTLMIFSDVLFDTDLVRRLLSCNEDVVLAVNRQFDPAADAGARARDYVALAEAPVQTRRALETGSHQTVVNIGKTLHPAEVHTEFIGLALFSEKGFGLLEEAWEGALARTDEGFHEAADTRKASFTDLIQEVIDRGYPVHALETSSGWMEIHSFDDYREACSVFARRGGANT